MKKYSFLLVLFLGFCALLQAQVKIGGDPVAPAASAILELDGGTNKGLLLPRMTKQNMNDIQNPSNGLTVFVTDEQAVYLRRTDGWVKQATTIDAFSLPYFGAFNTNGASFEVHNLNGGSALSGFATGLASVAVRGNTLNGVGLGGYATTGIGGYFEANANAKALITGLGRVGIGTASPAGVLHIDGTNQTGNTVTIVDDQDPFILLQKAGIATGFLQTLGNDFKLGTVLTNPSGSFIVRTGNADRLFLDNAGLLGIGNASSDARLYIDATNTGSAAMIINDQNPTVQLQNSGVNKGVLQLNGDDIRIGTNVENATGNIILRAGGVDRISVDNAGDMTIGSIVNKDATLSTFAANDAVNAKANIDLQSNFGTTFGPNIKFTGRSPLLGELASITTTSTRVVNSSKTGRFDWVQPGKAETLAFLRNFQGPGTSQGGLLNVTKAIALGDFGINQLPEANLHIVKTAVDFDYTMILGTVTGDPIVSFRNVLGLDRGLIQLNNNDMKIGTFANNNLGRFAVRTNGFDRLFVNPDGKVIIGSTTGSSPIASEILQVKGGILASAFTVQAVNTWPDYVFADGYKLKSLEETEAFIKANKHLPNIPAAAEIEKNGLELGDMQKRMMEKIEELTLHLIESNKRIIQLEQVVSSLKTKK